MDQKTERKPVRLSTIKKMYEAGEPIVMLTCYDATFSSVEDEAGVDIKLIGDSLGMVMQGHETTLPVTIDDMVYHTACVARGNKYGLVLADMNFGSYLVNEDEAVANAVKLMQAGAHMVKFEGGVEVCPLARRLTAMGIPVCGHVGFTPQSVNAIGGYFVQGKTKSGEEKLLADTLALQEAGASMIVLEMVPADVAKRVTEALSIPTIGIGGGLNCSGQVLVLQDLLGIFPGRKPRFTKNFMEGAASIKEAVANYVKAVKNRKFPASEHSF